MSLNVLVIPEDATHDQYVLKPMIEAMLNALDRPKAKVRVYKGFGGYGDALRWDNIAERVLDAYGGMVDLFVLCVDRDGDSGRAAQLTRLEQNAADRLKPGQSFLAENAHQEIEVWVLAGHELPSEWSWSDIRAERDSKERYYDVFASQRDPAWKQKPADGLKALGKEAADRYARVRQLCPEDVGRLEDRVRAWLAANSD